MATKKTAPKFLNLFYIKLPAGGVASIGHRISGVLMFLSIPLLAYLFGLSLADPQGFQQAREFLRSAPLLVVSAALVWSLSHHLLAGIRHLLLDVDIGTDKAQGRASAWLVNVAALLMTGAYLAVLI